MEFVKNSRALTLFVMSLFISVGFAFAPLSVEAATITVPTDYATLQEAVDAAVSGDTIVIDSNITTGHIDINKDLSIVGSSTKPVISPDANRTGVTTSSAWFFVNPGVTLNLNNVVLDGGAFWVTTAIRSHGTLNVDTIDFKNIRASASGSPYQGFAIMNFGGTVPGGAGNDTHSGGGSPSALTVENSTFTNIGRIGVLIKGTDSDAIITGNTFTGKGTGDFLDYGVEVGAGGSATISNNSFSACHGVAASDGSTSAGVLVTDYYGTGSNALITNNTFSDCYAGIAAGYLSTDASIVEAHNNTFLNSDFGIESTGPSTDIDAEMNWWGDASGPVHASSTGTGTPVSDFVDYSPWCTNQDCTDYAPQTFETIIVVKKADLAATSTDVVGNPTKWWFNRDTSTQSPFEFSTDAASIGTGSVFVQPITNTINGNYDKFIGELFVDALVSDLESISYDFRIVSPDATAENEFYMSVYALLPTPNNWYDCRYSVVPTIGSTTAFMTVTFDSDSSYPVANGSGSYTCPAKISEMPAGSMIPFIALNVGDTSAADAGVSGYFDNVQVTKKDGVNTNTTIFDFEPTPLIPVEDTVVVTNSDLKGWTITTAADGFAHFIPNSTAPLGDGNLNMTTTDTNADRVRATKEVSAPLADLGTELSYQTRQNESHCGGCSNAAYRIYFDADGNLETTGDTAELVYEPYWQNDKLGDPAPVTPDVWQTWDVDAGFFWAGIPAANQPNLPQLTNGAGGPPFYTLADIESFYPDAVVYAISVGIGTYNPTNDIDVDAVKFSYVTDTEHVITTYDFEPNLAPEAYDMTVLIPFNLGGIFNLAADDAEDDALTASIVAAAGHGTVETVSGLKVDYTPTLGFFGYDSFTFTVNDGTSDSNVATVAIIIYKDPICPDGGSFVGGGSGNCMKMVDTVVAGVTVKLPEFYTASCPEGSTLVKPHDACEADGGTPGIPDEVDNTFDIEATAGENGAIVPSGTVAVVSGTDKTFIITPDNGYVVDSVLVDNEPVGAVTEYEFTDVDEEHTIHATFKTAPEAPEEEEETSSNNPPRSGGGGGGGGYIPPVPQVLGASTTAPCFQFTRGLAFGMNGADILELQKILATKGFLTATPNGNFGPATQAAVMAFQKANGLEQVGSVGPKTRALLNASCTPGANPNQALIDELTKKLQALLAQIQQILASRGQ